MIRLNDLKNQTVRVIEEGICIGVDSLVQEIKDICKVVRVPRKITDYYEIQDCIHIIPQETALFQKQIGIFHLIRISMLKWVSLSEKTLIR